ncbi:MAG: hypothetical protein HY300_18355 [Verrucomicrobia bacterium]|nr:hypothetical protein [Verrucomicrobiota bacterium]
MRELKKIAFLAEEFALQTPAQQLLDRFLLGYPRDGEWRKFGGTKIALWTPPGAGEEELKRRAKDFSLVVEKNVVTAVRDADAIVVASRGPAIEAMDTLLLHSLKQAAPGRTCFAHGALVNTLAGWPKLREVAEAGKHLLLAGTPLAVTWRLPQVDLPKDTQLTEALIVTQGEWPVAEFNALDGLLPVIERRRGGESGVKSMLFLAGDEVWRFGDAKRWSWPLLASALSRSDSPQGDALKDGRTQDLVGLGLVPKLAREPRGWFIEHEDGLRTSVLVLDGVVADINFAVQSRDGQVRSAQLLRAPAPAENHFSRLAAVVEDFFRSGSPPWPVERSVLQTGLMEAFRKSGATPGIRIMTPQLRLRYAA